MQPVTGIRYRLFNGVITEPIQKVTLLHHININWNFYSNIEYENLIVEFYWNNEGIAFDGEIVHLVPDYNIKEIYLEEKPVKHMDQMTLADWQRNIDRMFDTYKLY